MKKTLATTGLALLLTLATTPIAATAADQPDETKTLRWTLPAGGTAENVTWPQTPYTGQAPECGQTLTIQVDVNKYGTETERTLVDSYDDDNVLTQGEDHPTVISWSFETIVGEPCIVPPEKPAPRSYSDSADGQPDCVTNTVTTTSRSGRYDLTLVNNLWVENLEPTIDASSTSTRQATAEGCPIKAIDTSTRTDEQAVPELAATGAISDPYQRAMPWMVGAGAVTLIGAALVILMAALQRKRINSKQ